MKPIYITKANGKQEEFSSGKTYQSAIRSGASDELAKKIVESVEKKVYPGIKTSEIFKIIEKSLQKEDSAAFLKFNLKEGIKRLGPTGFPFEKFVGDVLAKMGFQTKIDQYIPGKCLEKYEIDFVAKKDQEIIIGECKYRNLPGEMVHLQDALANSARFQDIKQGAYFEQEQKAGDKMKSLLVTNTKFTHDAMNYSACAGVGLLGWKHPKDRGLEYLIEKYQLYPITILPLQSYMKDALVGEQIMLVRDLLDFDAEKFSKKYKIPMRQINNLISDAKSVILDY